MYCHLAGQPWTGYVQMNIRTGHSRAVKRRMTVDLARMSEKGLEDIRRHLTPVQPKQTRLGPCNAHS